MSAPARRVTRQTAAGRWETIRYAIGSTARTMRLCLILLVPSVSAALITFLLHL